jgi:hypothetical protein
MRRDVWNTYKTVCYTYDVANDQRSAGGVHHHQVKRTKAGWFYRICQSNGSFESYGDVTPLSDQEGEARFETAKNR